MSAESFNDQSFEQQSSHKMFEISREPRAEARVNVNTKKKVFKSGRGNNACFSY